MLTIFSMIFFHSNTINTINSRKRCQICSNLATEVPGNEVTFRTASTSCYSFSIVDFECFFTRWVIEHFENTSVGELYAVDFLA